MTRHCSAWCSSASTPASNGSSRWARGPCERETGNPLTCGTRFDTRDLTEALVRAAGPDVRIGEPLTELPGDTPVVLATGGFQADRELVARSRDAATPPT